MAAEITPLDLSVEDIPVNQVKGSYNRRRVRIYMTGTATSADTCDLSTYVPKLSALEGKPICWIADAVSYGSTATVGTISWSGTILTFGNTGTVNVQVLGYMS